MDFILENYLLIILVGLFFVFALIGYLIDMLRKSHEIEKENIPNDIKPIEITNINKLQKTICIRLFFFMNTSSLIFI